MEEKIEELIEEIGQSAFASRQARPFNQPDLIAISSLDRNVEDPNANGFNSFTVNLPLPALDVKSLQLLQTNIPQASANIPNTACTFWYYRLSVYSGLTPSINNLYYVRLLPTTYKQEYIYQPTQYGYNQTFNSYSAVATQLVKSCATDLLRNNVNALVDFLPATDTVNNAYVPFLPNDVSITYDSGSNKFQMTGLNTQVAYLLYDAETLYAVGDVITNASRNIAYINLLGSSGISPTTSSFPVWASGTNYAVGNIITFNNIVYKLTTNGENVNQNPAVQTPAFYTRLGRLLPVSSYSAWVSGTNYAVGDAVSYEGVVYVLYADGETTTTNPARQPTKWVSQPTQITAPSSVWAVKRNIEIVGEWFSNMFYPVGTIVYYEGALYSSTSIEPSAFNQPPTNDDYWDVFTPPANWYRYLITGYSDPLVRKLQGELFNVEWNSGRTYNENARVFHNKVPFIANKTNRGDEPFISFPVWKTAVLYNANDVVSHEGNIYIARITNTSYNPAGATTIWVRLTAVSSNPPLNAWSDTTTYSQFDLVEYNGVMYQSLSADANVGNNPFNNVEWWVLRNYQTWNSNTAYQNNSLVFYNDYFYQTNINNNTGNIPIYSSAVWDLLGSNLLEWSSIINYNIGDYSIYGSRYFKSLINDNVSNSPVSFPEGWELIGAVETWRIATAPLQTGLYGLTSRYDMTEFIGNIGVITNFPYGVGGQPFNPNPKRLLNSILGFTWAGSFNPSQLTDIQPYTRAVLTTTQAPLLYNRLRPVPDYIVSLAPPTPPLEEELGQDQSATISLTYTADGYANLVYSSIISIYADIVKASSVDTQGTTKLLALTSMNCGNLGIAFWSNYIENPLLKVQGDIYSIYIEFRDEFGEPFVLTNNAVATLTFKLNY
jgi:hypothetical protein